MQVPGHPAHLQAAVRRGSLPGNQARGTPRTRGGRNRSMSVGQPQQQQQAHGQVHRQDRRVSSY